MKQQLTGRITANAKVNEVSNNREVVNFTVAVNERFKTKAGEWEQKTSFIDCAYWRSSKVAQYLTKGALVSVAGFISAGAFINKRGEAVGTIKCKVSEIDLHEKSNGKTKTGNRNATVTEAVTEAEADLPF